MNRTLILALVTLLLVGGESQGFVFNLAQNDKNGKALGRDVCNKDTEIDFMFGAATQFNSCNSTGCTMTHANSSGLRFLDAYGNNLTYTLDSMQTTSQSTHPSTNRAIRFKFINGNRVVYVEVPLFGTNESNPSARSDLINLLGVYQGNDLIGIRRFLLGQSFQLSSFNFLNLREFGHFYTVARQENGQAVTLLTSSFIYFLTSYSASFNFAALSLNESFSQLSSGDKVCYGSLIQMGMFQTHLRESFPLWTAWVSILLFWLYNLLAEPNTLECYDKQFENNSLTCWGFYSLHKLGNEQFFTKLSRSTVLLTNFVWQACVLACIYGTLYTTNLTIIIWSAIIAFGASIPLPFFLGCVFLSPIYQTTTDKFEIIRKSKQMTNKDSAQALEGEIDVCQERLYGLYYWFYMSCFFIFVTSWIVAVHLMVQLPRQYAFLHPYWLASLAITFAIDNLIYEPIMSLIFGSFAFWRKRGHFYDYRLGQLNKLVSD